MGDEPAEAVTRAIHALVRGNGKLETDLLPILYAELKKLARARLAKVPPGQTLQTTALVHEAYLRLLGDRNDVSWNGRRHFFGAAARAMREILIERARRQGAKKRGGDRERDFEEIELASEQPVEDVIALDEALGRLEELDPRKAEIVMLRYFAGLSEEETAAALEVSVRTVEREWRYIRVWLFKQLGDQEQKSGK